MKKIEKWEAFDGTIFETEEECEKYEQNSKVVVLNELTETFPNLGKFARGLKLITRICENTGCKTCLFANGWGVCMFSDYPEEWDLDGITKIFTKINDGDKESNNNENSDSRRI